MTFSIFGVPPDSIFQDSLCECSTMQDGVCLKSAQKTVATLNQSFALDVTGVRPKTDVVQSDSGWVYFSLSVCFSHCQQLHKQKAVACM